ncbi:gamma-glutamylcyclotransferase [Pleionea sp. CnH1-48]|uniref:gamma-glutamylcyclotransferase family protein n=1 Tax=Pleionea sp. CnH1-48 TaxID=2954494 RepID=UPI002097A2CF|nr:gamma-glutamylcyclotransferase [Pleionea sp. CnH1-48]
MKRLFVYGTLAPGRVNHHVLANVPGNWESASLKGHLFYEGWGADMGCPGIVPSETGESVEGYVLSSDCLEEYWDRLDEFEGSGYQRELAKVKLANGEFVEAFVYALSGGS